MGCDWYDINNYSFRGIFIPRKLLLKNYNCPPGLSIGYVDKNEYVSHVFVYITHSLCTARLNLPGPYEITHYGIKVSRMNPLDTRLTNEDIAILTEAYKCITGQIAEASLVGFWNILSTYSLEIGDSALIAMSEERCLEFSEFQQNIGYKPEECTSLESRFCIEWGL